ncbi:MAG: hypothetical protein IJK46_05525 [Prevotella sp.]|nr:hypothetical protein [Prevotella sp.]
MNKKERFCDVDNIVEWRHIITTLLTLIVFVSCGDEEVIGSAASLEIEEPIREQQTEQTVIFFMPWLSFNDIRA